jgi:hypothetical protein
MSNRLKPVQVEIIRRLWQQGWKNRAIARSTGINRNTVNRYVEQWREAASAGAALSCEAKAAKLQSGSALDPPPISLVGPEAGTIVAGANEANLHFVTRGRFHPAKRQGLAGTQPSDIPPHAVIAAGKPLLATQVLEDTLGREPLIQLALNQLRMRLTHTSRAHNRQVIIGWF